jgi:hypothetical protein
MKNLMPDTTTVRYRRSRASNVLLVLAAISVTFMLFYPHIVSAQGTTEDQYEDPNACEDPRVVETFQGNTTQETRPFDINADRWQVVIETEATNPQGFTFVDVVERPSFSRIVTRQLNNGADSTINLEGSGRASLDIFTDLQSYDITVQECGASNAPPDNGTGPAEPDPDAGQDPGDNEATEPQDEDSNNDETDGQEDGGVAPGVPGGGGSGPVNSGEGPAQQGGVSDIEGEDNELAEDRARSQPVQAGTTPATGGPPLAVIAAVLLWTGVGGILITRRFAARRV